MPHPPSALRRRWLAAGAAAAACVVAQGALAGPDFSTDILGTFLYRTFFGFQLQLGDPYMGSAIAGAMFGIILVGVCVYLFGIQTRLRRYQF